MGWVPKANPLRPALPIRRQIPGEEEGLPPVRGLSSYKPAPEIFTPSRADWGIGVEAAACTALTAREPTGRTPAVSLERKESPGEVGARIFQPLLGPNGSHRLGLLPRIFFYCRREGD